MTIGPGYEEPPPAGTFGEEGRFQERIGEAAKQEAKAVADHMRTQAKDAGEKAKVAAETSFEHQKGRVAREAEGLASALRTTADQLEQQDQPTMAVYARSVANVAERVADSVSEQEFRGFVGSVDRVARRDPFVVFAGAAALGYLASRAIRAARESELLSPAGQTPRPDEIARGSTEGPVY
ncbi:MAG: hypothetical protein H5U40_13975 [Polyangiaceae bacterium]|nr:hypothetical protein [Polyangiaceae bacterium]